MNKEEYLQLIEQHPKLTMYGFGIDHSTPQLMGDGTQFELARQELRDGYQEFLYCCQWIELNPKLSGRETSYNWKHRVSGWLANQNIRANYIGEGIFIIAAIHKGYKIHKMRKSIGVRFSKPEESK